MLLAGNTADCRLSATSLNHTRGRCMLLAGNTADCRLSATSLHHTRGRYMLLAPSPQGKGASGDENPSFEAARGESLPRAMSPVKCIFISLSPLAVDRCLADPCESF